MTERIGFMQGRLCDLVDGMIQAFPWRDWRLEFSRAQALGLCMMEWTIDQSGLYDNPVMTEAGRREIARLSKTHGLVVPSLTGDCFMQAPFWKAAGAERSTLQRDFTAVAAASAKAGIEIIVVPIVDNGRIETVGQGNCLVDFLNEQHEALKAQGVKIVFEFDFGPAEAARFLERLPSDTFGLNYDIGNSAALGGRLDILVCNVGSGGSVPPGHETAAEWHRVFGLNLWSATNAIEAAKDALCGSRGAIVCISSICGVEVVPGAPVTYSAAKAALNAYVRGIARPFGKDQVRINAIAPGNILFDGSVWDRKARENPMAMAQMLERDVALARLGDLQSIADWAAWLASPRCNFVTGQIYVVDGGQVRT